MELTNKDVWVFIEQRNGKPADVSFELLSKGHKLAGHLKSELKAVVIGHNVKSIVEESFKYGVNEALVVDHPDLVHYRTYPYSRIINDLVKKFKPRVMLYGATVIGRDLAPHVASNTKSGLTADCTELQISDVKYLKKEYKDLLLQIRPAFGGNIIATIISPDIISQMATVREGVMKMEPVDNPVNGLYPMSIRSVKLV
jgi:electron transfer flavoprotein alpha subunit